MRLFSFLICFLVVLAPIAGRAQTVPPGATEPKAEDLGTLPEAPAEDEPKARAAEEPPLETLYRQLAGSGDEAEARRIARSIQILWLKSGSDTVDLLMERAAQALKADNYPLALDLLDTVVTLKPAYAEGWNRRATVYYMRQDFGRSLADIERVLALEPRHWGALSGLGIIQRQLDQDQRALATFRKVLEVYPLLDSARKAVEELEKDLAGEPT
ncbi:tetratricopeptide repeat protein [Microvirga tunisiensis]|uniref:Tetratricopeptide repeat protein n=2 Tax=Pannonibacter tanglangensis TaxID=2750084 RepID=A0A7X5JAT0_9HYPH|nr:MULTISPECIES: tetratricopeptide repeat protein [unclassified Pannonibacter]NBN65298.1 tetratricopeptide repeat protein [Pannonibacter sp. XCT-34]NBN79725.1 tetratricopeptide repeat protein [Pannonibacter sp. XCT-53]